MKVSDIEVSYIDHMGTDLSVVNAARVSFHKVSHEFKDGDSKLINYLAKHKHFSPFNHSFISLRIKAPIFVARQLVKHRFMPWNEVSRRYVDEEPEFYIPEMRKKAENVKQGSSNEVADTFSFFANYCNLEVYTYEYLNIGLDLYSDAIAKGIAPEVARAFLPQNTMTEWMWSGTLGAWADMLRLRLDPHAQLESRIVAIRAREIISPLFPVSLKALLEN